MPRLAHILHPLKPSWSNAVTYPTFLLSAFWQDWLLDAGSLTARLKALRPGEFWVKVEYQGYTQATPTECAEMQLGNNRSVWVRQVTLYLGEVAVIHARTAIPLSTISGQEKRLQHLGNSSLGSYLFRQPSLRRGELKVSRCNTNSYALSWARRSVFYLHNKPLMVSEAFADILPELANR